MFDTLDSSFLYSVKNNGLQANCENIFETEVKQCG